MKYLLMILTNGPYLAAKEYLAGYYPVDCDPGTEPSNWPA
jgi:hypothetical protein